MKKETWEAVINAYNIEASCLTEMKEYIVSDVCENAVSLLKSAPRIGTSGCGHSGIMCQHFAHLLCCIERPAKFISPSEAVHGGMGYIQPGDVMVLASRGGKSIPFITRNSSVLSSIAESEPAAFTTGRILSISSSITALSIISSRASIRSTLPRMVFISPLCSIKRFGWARSQLGVVLVEKRECTSAIALS